jgi:hypothetical protein
MELNIQMSINMIKKRKQNLTQSQIMERNQKRSHLTVIDGNVYQIKNKKQNQLKQTFK